MNTIANTIVSLNVELYEAQERLKQHHTALIGDYVGYFKVRDHELELITV